MVLKITKTHINVGKELHASPDKIWGLITDTTKWPQWGPTVKSVRSSERFIRKGSKGQVLTSVGLWLPFVITEYEHKSFWSWKVASVRATGHRLRPTHSGGCYLWFEVPIFAAPYLLVCQMALNRVKSIATVRI